MITVTIEAVDRTSDITRESVVLDQTLSKEPATLKFSIEEEKAQLSLGDSVKVTEDASDIFLGTVIEKQLVSVGNVIVGYYYTCMDGYYELDRHLVQQSYSNTTARALVLDILTNYVSGITLDMPLTSPTITTAKFNYELPSRCITLVMNSIGWDWYIDAANVLHAFPENETDAPFSITDDNGNMIANSLVFTSSILELKNIVWVRGGEYSDPIAEDDAVDKYESNGVDNTFPLVFRYESVQVTVNGTPQTVGVEYIDEMVGDALSTGSATSTSSNKLVDSAADFVTDGVAVGDQVYNSTDKTYAVVTNVDNLNTLSLNKDIFVSGENYQVSDVLKNCLYSYQEKSIRFPDGTLNNGDVVRVYGDAKVPLIVQAIDQDSIVAYGEREAARVDKTLTSIEEAEVLANSSLEKWREGSSEGSFRTYSTGLRVGQTLTVQSIRYGIDSTYKVNRIHGVMVSPNEFQYTVQFITSGQITFTDILVDILGRDKKNIEIGPDEVIQKLRIVEDSFGFSDEIVNVTSNSPPYHYSPVTTGNAATYNFGTYT